MPVTSAEPNRGLAEDAIVLGVLDAIERNPSVTQRSVARELGIALGLANAYLKRCIRKGLIKVGKFPRGGTPTISLPRDSRKNLR